MRSLDGVAQIWSAPVGTKDAVLKTYVLTWRENDEDEDVFVSRVPAEIYTSAQFSLEDIEGTPVPIPYYRVEYETGWTVFEGPMQDHHFLKRSSISGYLPDEDKQDWPSTELRDEINIYEKLKDHPHPNIVKYHGVQVKDGYVAGIVIDKLDAEIYDALGAPRKASHILDIEVAMKDLRSAVDHLHSIGIVHCDICPSNLGLDSKGRIIMFDFDCAFPIGALRYGKVYNDTWAVKVSGCATMGYMSIFAERADVRLICAYKPEILMADYACREIDYECLRLTREKLLDYPQVFEAAEDD